MNALQIRNTESVSIQIVPAAFTMRQDVLDDSATIITVTTPVTQKAAVEAARAIASLLKAVETSRKEAKAPVLDLGQRIDATAKEFIKDVLAEEARLKRLLTDYEIEQRRLAMEAERKRQEEERKLRAAEEARLAEIRRREEAARRDAMMAETEAQRIAAERAMACAEFDRAAAAAARPIVASAPIQPVKTAGTIVRDEWNFEVTDLAAFAAAPGMHPSPPFIITRTAAPRRRWRR